MSNYYQDTIADIDDLHVAGGAVPYLKSFPGEGKSALLIQMAQRDQVRTATGTTPVGGYTTLLLGTCDETDVSGIPLEGSVEIGGEVWPTTNTATPHWAVEAQRHALNGHIYYIFLDEVTRAKQDVQGSVLTALSDRVLPNGFRLHENIRFMLAGNGVEHDASAYDLIPALTNRLAHMDFAPPLVDWAEGMRINFGKPASASEMRWRTIVANYLTSNVSAARQTSNDDRKGAWVSKRSWTNVAKYLGAVSDESRIRASKIDTIVGRGQGDPFLAYYRGLVLPEPEEMLRNPACLDALDKPSVWASLNNLAIHVNQDDPSQENVEKAIGVLTYAATDNADVSVMVMVSVIRDAISKYPTITAKLVSLIGDNFNEVSEMIEKFSSRTS